jgi:hypothetical protein
MNLVGTNSTPGSTTIPIFSSKSRTGMYGPGRMQSPPK